MFLLLLIACDTQSINNLNKVGICTLMVDSSKYTMEQLNDINVKLTIGEPASLAETDRKQIFLNEIARRTTKDWHAASRFCKDTCSHLMPSQTSERDQEVCNKAFDKAVHTCFISGFCYEGEHIRK